MANKKTPKKEGPKKLMLRRNGGHRREYGASLACYRYQKEELKRRAARGVNIDGSYHPCSVSYYLNWLLWRDQL